MYFKLLFYCFKSIQCSEKISSAVMNEKKNESRRRESMLTAYLKCKLSLFLRSYLGNAITHVLICHHTPIYCLYTHILFKVYRFINISDTNKYKYCVVLILEYYFPFGFQHAKTYLGKLVQINIAFLNFWPILGLSRRFTQFLLKNHYIILFLLIRIFGSVIQQDL